jgi:hypothetical protein
MVKSIRDRLPGELGLPQTAQNGRGAAPSGRAQQTTRAQQAARAAKKNPVQDRLAVDATEQAAPSERTSLAEQVHAGLQRLGASAYGTDTTAIAGREGALAGSADHLVDLHGGLFASALGMPPEKGRQLAADLALLITPA